jgi:nucleotide-binding universal stress UspA family protein
MPNNKNRTDNNRVKEDIFGGTEILACIDGSSTSSSVCDYAAWIAVTTDRPLKLVHTIEQNYNAAISDYSGAIGLGSQQALLKELTEVEQSHASLLIKKGQMMLNVAKERVENFGVTSVETYQHKGTLAESLVDLEKDMRVMVIGIRGEQHDDEHRGIGHQLESVIRSIHRPILVVNKEYQLPKTVMLAHDGSDFCNKALQLMASSKLFKNLNCHIVHVGGNGAGLLESATKILSDADIQVTSIQLEGQVDTVLTNYQVENDIDLTLMGAFSHNRFRDFLLGSFTVKMLQATNRPLLLLR